MPSSDLVREHLVDITVEVLGCDPDAVVDDATFTELGADSLTVVEIAEELGRRCGVYLSDETVDRFRTVGEAVEAAAREPGDRPRDGSPPIPGSVIPAAPAAAGTPTVAPAAIDVIDTSSTSLDERQQRRARSVAWRMTAIGLVIGGLVGLLFAGMVNATGIADVALPPLPGSQSTAEETTPTPAPTKATPTSKPAAPKPTLTTPKNQVAPGERFVLEGKFPDLGAGAELQVEVKDGDGPWDDFPITTRSIGQGQFTTQIYTSRTGVRQFRVTEVATGTSTPAVKVQIG